MANFMCNESGNFLELCRGRICRLNDQTRFSTSDQAPVLHGPDGQPTQGDHVQFG